MKVGARVGERVEVTRGPVAGRAGRRCRRVPHRLREPPARLGRGRGHAGHGCRAGARASRRRRREQEAAPPAHDARPRGLSVIERIIEWSARAPLGRLRRGARARHCGRSIAIRKTPLDAIPDLSDPAGDRLHRVDGPQPRSGRRPDHLSARARAAEHAGRAHRARLLDVRDELHLRHLRRGHRHLLGAHARARAARARAAAAARRRRRRRSDPTRAASAGSISTCSKTRRGRLDLAELRALQDFTVRPALQACSGVAEVASLGGFERQYQILLDPAKLDARTA